MTLHTARTSTRLVTESRGVELVLTVSDVPAASAEGDTEEQIRARAAHRRRLGEHALRLALGEWLGLQTG